MKRPSLFSDPEDSPLFQEKILSSIAPHFLLNRLLALLPDRKENGKSTKTFSFIFTQGKEHNHENAAGKNQ
jgi:hypothetical protein